jgi:hypothetical protein
MPAGSPCRFRGGHGGPFLSAPIDPRVHVCALQAPAALDSGSSKPVACCSPYRSTARLLEHRPGCGSSRYRWAHDGQDNYAGPQALLRVPAATIRRAESVPEGGLQALQTLRNYTAHMYSNQGLLTGCEASGSRVQRSNKLTVIYGILGLAGQVAQRICRRLRLVPARVIPPARRAAPWLPGGQPCQSAL